MELNERDIFVPKGNLNIPRRNMPQIDKAHFPDLFVWLQKQGAGVRRTKIRADTLKPIQKEINIQAVDKLIKTKDPKLKKPFLVSKDGYIIDGHHRWLALLNIDPKTTITAFEIGAGVQQSLDLLRKYPRTLYKDPHNAEYNKPDHNLRMEQTDMPLTEKERLVAELKETLRGIDPALMSGAEYAMVVESAMGELINPLSATSAESGSFKDFVAEAKMAKYSDPEEKLQIRGFGVVKVGELERMLESRMAEVDKFIKRKDWRNVRALIMNTAIMPMLDALKMIQDARD